MTRAEALTILDGPMGTAIEQRGLELTAPLWTAAAVLHHPDAVRDAHRCHAEAGAQVHTTATFRTTRRALKGTPWEADWADVARRATDLCREGAGAGARLAGSMAPLEDCYRPDLVPSVEQQREEHTALAEVLASAGVDLLLVETMCSLEELETATEAALATGLPVWAAVTTGPAGDFFTPDGILAARNRVAELGAQAFLLNCIPPAAITALMGRLAAEPSSVLLGAYGNAIFPGHEAVTVADYLGHARRWRAAGAAIIGTCCGTGPGHLAALSALS